MRPETVAPWVCGATAVGLVCGGSGLRGLRSNPGGVCGARNFDAPGARGPLAGCLRVTVGNPAEDDLRLAALRDLLAA